MRVDSIAAESWSGPAVIAAPDPQRPWMGYGPGGRLGVMWRTNKVDVFSTVSFDHGRSFGTPIQVNRETEPRGNSGPPGDRWSGIVLTDTDAYVAWSDARSGELDSILARVPLDRFPRATG